MNSFFKSLSPFIAFILLFCCSCEGLLDVNTDTDNPSIAPPDLLLPPILGFYAVNCYQQGETTSYFTQHVATLSGVSRVKDLWDYRSVTREGIFRRHYHNVANNVRNLIDMAEAEESENYEAVGHIMMVFTTQTATDLLGQMPYLEALQGHPSPPYDKQEVIYNGMFAEIDVAINLLENIDPTDRPMTGVEDIVYKGNLESWLSLAHGLKARLLLHLTPNINQNYSEIVSEVEIALQSWEDPLFSYTTGPSEYQINGWGPSQPRPAWDYIGNTLNLSAPTDFLLQSILGYDPINHIIDDPRTPLLMTPNASLEYLSVRTSEGRDLTIDEEDYPDLYNTYYTSDDSPIPYMTEEELHFIHAEALFLSGNADAAYTAYLTGIRRHMERVGVVIADIDAFLSISSLIPQSSGDLELSHIMKQKWLALYLQAEAWVDMRRYQYDPVVYVGLERPANLADFWSETDDTEWIQRIPYDNQTEEIYNRPELERLGAFQNPDWLKVPLWWAERN